MKVHAKKYGERYPWADWFKLKKFKLYKGKHYIYPSYIMAQMVRNAATKARYNKTVNIQIDPLDRYIVVRVREKVKHGASHKRPSTATVQFFRHPGQRVVKEKPY